ncbi:alpha/beta-hydrolase [Eremomyces bilateralis CBS 781.70]|uniref:Carboxylic ester hydrolase n=1 Tax=Eremomyces bilateralis CBS 781.70 TaxID=1392243 RepID=A0A6G1GFX2_9PEZI|nr:alpha/beta-hydrolase [Eremomyces bilateralis CBS 781.70]KAF1816769.1 alpha/beta-hydrolase [Eremomyces bilateralis CBS 781.70]
MHFFTLLLSSIVLVGEVVGTLTWRVGQPVLTTSGLVVGQASSKRSAVSEYLGIPFAKPPVGDLRWAPPQTIRHDGKVINATQYSSCAESASRLANSNPDSPQNIGQSENEQREDCLYLNIWTKPQIGDRKKAVMIWIYGGGFVVGSGANAVYNGASLADEEDVILVTINYRLGVLGFSGVPLPERNFGLLDQRVAIEWLRDNIARFGGDPRRMVIFGQSAGGLSVDFYSYAYRRDPIVSGFISQSGSASGIPASPPSNATVVSWSGLSNTLGCGTVASESDATKTLKCMRDAPASAILDATAPRESGDAVGTWGPKADEKTIPSGLAARAARGEFVKRPMLVGNVNNEGASSGTQPGSLVSLLRNCPSSAAARARRAAGVPAWRYLYAGEFPNQSLGPAFANVSGAWHGAEIALIFGNTGLGDNGPDTENETKLIKKIRAAWTGFAKDPVRGLSKLGWPQYDLQTESVIVIGGRDSDAITFESPSVTDQGVCNSTALKA